MGNILLGSETIRVDNLELFNDYEDSNISTGQESGYGKVRGPSMDQVEGPQSKYKYNKLFF